MSDTAQKATAREFWVFFGPWVALTILGFFLAFTLVGPPPPKTLRFASGSSWGAYNKFAQQYREVLAKQGLNIEVLETKGSTDNLRLLLEGEADIAFVQGGVVPEDSAVKLQCLGSVYFEPMWLFTRGREPKRLLLELEGSRLAIGAQGSGTRAIALELLEDAGMLDKVETVPVGGEKAEQMYQAGELDAVFLVGPPTIPVIRRMLTAKDTQLMQFERAKAFERRHQFLSVVPLYGGVVDMEEDVPNRDLQVLAPAATLVVREDFHRSLPAVFLTAATEIHGKGSMLSEHGDFPSPAYCSFPVREEARHYYQYGTSFLYRHLPFYLASAADRLAILLLPLVGLFFPIIKLLPPVYGFTMKRKIYKRYRRLQNLENSVERLGFDAVMEQIEEMERETAELISLPSWYAADLYGLRTNLERARERLNRLKSQVPKKDVS